MTTQIDASFDRIDPLSQARVREAYQNAGDDPNGAGALAQIVALAGGAVAQGAAGTQAWPVGDAVAESTLAGILSALTDESTLGVTGGAAVVSDADGTLQQYLRGLVKLAAAATNGAGQYAVYSAPNPQPPVAYRAAVSAPDCLPPPALGAGSAVAGGSLAAGTTYQIKVVAANAYGRTTPAQGTPITTGASALTARQPISAVIGAMAYDIYLSTDADPKWAGRISAAQLAAGAVIDAVGSTASGGVANAVDIQVAGTGQGSGTTAACNSAYTVPLAASTTVNATSNAGQAVLGVASTAGFTPGAGVLVGAGTARYELCTIASIQAGTSLTLAAALQRAHTGAQADPVVQPAMANTEGFRCVDFDVAYANTGDNGTSSTPGVTLAPFYLNARQGSFFQGQAIQMACGQSAAQQRLRVEPRGCPGVALLVQQIGSGGSGATVTVDYALS